MISENLKRTRRSLADGFTLVELLIVIAILAILATLVFVALKPQARYQDARNARRWSDVNNIIGAIKLYQTDHGGAYLSDIEYLTADKYYQIGSSGESSCSDTCSLPTGMSLEADCVYITSLVDYGYLASIPYDPNASGASEEESRYYLMKNSNGSLTVGACSPELGSNSSVPTITVSR